MGELGVPGRVLVVAATVVGLGWGLGAADVAAQAPSATTAPPAPGATAPVTPPPAPGAPPDAPPAGPPGATAPPPAPAGSPEAIAAAVFSDGWYADLQAVGDRGVLGSLARRQRLVAHPVGFALLAAEPTSGTSTDLADRALDALDALTASQPSAVETIVVVSPDDVGLASDVWSDEALDDALDDAIDDLRADPAVGLETLTDALADQETGFDDDESGGGFPTGLVVLGAVGAAALLLGYRALGSRTGGEGLGDDDTSSDWSGSADRARRRRRSFASSRRSSSRSSRSSGRSSSRSSGRKRGRAGRRL